MTRSHVNRIALALVLPAFFATCFAARPALASVASCQKSIVKETQKFLTLKSKALQKCEDRSSRVAVVGTIGIAVFVVVAQPGVTVATTPMVMACQANGWNWFNQVMPSAATLATGKVNDQKPRENGSAR